MATLFKYFKKQSLPTSNEAELPDAVTTEVNNAVENILEEERSRASGKSESILTSHQKLEQELPSMLLNVEMQQQ